MFDIADLTPHGFCLAWDPALLWLQAASDLAIAGAYYSIPIALLRFAGLRRDLAFPWIFRLFAAFILACGTTHILGVVTLWYPVYWIDGIVKFATALLSIATAILLWPLLARALLIPSQEQLRALNQRLGDEVAERQAIADRLRANEARLQSMYSRTPAPLHAADLDGRLIEVSDQWLELLGYSRDQVVGRKLSLFHAPGTEDQARSHWDTVLLHGAVRDQEHTLVHHDGSLRTVLASATLEREGPGHPSIVVAALADITGRKQTEAALEVSEAHLRQAQKMEAVGQLTGGIAHDFNNMLTGVNCVMELLHKRLPEGDNSRHLVASVLEASGRAAKLTAQLLAFSRRQRLVSEPLAPLEVAREMGPLLTRPLGEHVRLVIEPAPDAWQCLADRNQLEAALLNLVLNARAAIEADGCITLSLTHIPHDEAGHLPDMQVGEDPLLPRDYVAITVADTGHGMSEETLQHAFEPFYTTKPVGQGTGLGLSQTYGFARQTGGTVRIESAVGQGTRVIVILPRATAEHAASGTKPAEASSGIGDGQTILLVEDEDTLRDVVVAALQDFNYRVVPARNADEALALLDRGATSIDMLFTDIVMPGSRNGVELAIELRRRWPSLPVLFATGYSDRKVLDRWPGRLEILAKPYSVDTVIQAMRRAAVYEPPEAEAPSEEGRTPLP